MFKKYALTALMLACMFSSVNAAHECLRGLVPFLCDKFLTTENKDKVNRSFTLNFVGLRGELTEHKPLEVLKHQLSSVIYFNLMKHLPTEPGIEIKALLGTTGLTEQNTSRMFNAQPGKVLDITVVKSRTIERQVADELAGLRITDQPQSMLGGTIELKIWSTMPEELKGQEFNPQNVSEVFQSAYFQFVKHKYPCGFCSVPPLNMETILEQIQIIKLLQSYDLESPQQKITLEEMEAWVAQGTRFKNTFTTLRGGMSIEFYSHEPARRQWSLCFSSREFKMIQTVLAQVYPELVIEP